VQALHDVLTYVTEHPACTKIELVNNLSGTEEAKKKEILIHLAWLLEKGHLIEFYNDVLSAPTEYPAFKYLPGEKQYQGSGGHRPPPLARPAPAAAVPASVEAPAPAEAAVTAETPVAEELTPPAEETPTVETPTEPQAVETEQAADPVQ
jgi:hypothetical protein